MIFGAKKKLIREQREKAIRMASLLCERKIEFSDFWQIYVNEEFIREELNRNKANLIIERSFFEDIDVVRNINTDDLQINNQIYILMSKYLKLNNIECSTQPFNSRLRVILDILPDWLYGQEDNWFKELITSLPSNINEKNFEQYCLNKILEAFRYEKEPPNWLQNSEWPIIEGKPLLFTRQDGEPNCSIESKFDHKITYYFINPDSGVSFEVEQYD
jgi:hypothetical protein